MSRWTSVASRMGWVAALACAGEPESAVEPGECPVRLAPEVAREAVVRVLKEVAPSMSTTCAGAVIAPNLVLTAAHCVSREVGGGIFDCDEINGWRLVEDGSGRGRLGEVYPTDALQLLRLNGDGTSARVEVQQAIAFGSPTRCVDNLAVVVPAEPLDIEPLPLRMASVTREGDELMLSGFPAIGARRRLVPLSVTHVAAALSSELAPAGALRLSGGACASDLGGAIYSEASGALVALPFSQNEADCEAPEAETLAIELSRYAEFIRRVAEDAGAELHGEAAPEAPLGDEHCVTPGSSGEGMLSRD